MTYTLWMSAPCWVPGGTVPPSWVPLASSPPPGVCRPLWGSLHCVWDPGGSGARPVRGPDQAFHRSHQDRLLSDLCGLRGLCPGECPLELRPPCRGMWVLLGGQLAAQPEQTSRPCLLGWTLGMVLPHSAGTDSAGPAGSLSRTVAGLTSVSWVPCCPGVPAAGTDCCAGYHLLAAWALRFLCGTGCHGAGCRVLLPRG